MNGSIGERMEVYGMVRKAHGNSIKSVCDSKQLLTILFSQFLLSSVV